MDETKVRLEQIEGNLTEKRFQKSDMERDRERFEEELKAQKVVLEKIQSEIETYKVNYRKII